MKSMKGNVQYDSKGITATQSIHLSSRALWLGHRGPMFHHLAAALSKIIGNFFLLHH